MRNLISTILLFICASILGCGSKIQEKPMNWKQKIEENIQTHGWQSQFVFDPEGEKPSFAYSIGFEKTFNHPEILIFGLGNDAMHTILSDIAHDLSEGVVFEKDKRISGVISEPYEVVFKAIQEEQLPEYLGAAVGFYDQPFRAWVMFWPDKNHVFPFEEGCESKSQNEALKIVEGLEE